MDAANAIGWARKDGVRAWVAIWIIDGVRDARHGGSQQGTSGAILIAPESRDGVVVLTNSDGTDASGLATRLLRVVLGLSERTYQVGDFSMTIAREGDRLFARIRDQKILLLPESARDYVFQGSDTQIIFETDGNGRAKELILCESGADAYLNRVK